MVYTPHKMNRNAKVKNRLRFHVLVNSFVILYLVYKVFYGQIPSGHALRSRFF
jgi:hypothetical protein